MKETSALGPLSSDLFGTTPRPLIAPLRDKYIIPPFSVLSARDGFWNNRKRTWKNMGIKSECGRDGGLSYNVGVFDSDSSIFDPVLTELCYRWFAPHGCDIIDPFAGGSVRGIVAGVLGYHYYGIDLSQRQIDSNIKQGDSICDPSNMPRWKCDDSMTVPLERDSVDFLFTCPPYGDLERYSDAPEDISTMEYHTFIAALGTIILRFSTTLRDDRFAAIVVGNFRDKRGFMRNFIGDTIRLFENAGLQFYNDAILVTPVGTLAMRVSKQFDVSRKMGMGHQNLLVFVKGDPKVGAQYINSGDLT